jgi:hypothetical protein
MAIGAAIALTGPVVALAQCNTDFTETLAASVLQQSGQGNLACTDFIGQNADPQITGMADVTTDPSIVVTYGAGKKSLDWVINSPTLEADVVIVEAADGKRCSYFYPNDARQGFQLSPGSDRSIKSATFCTDNALVDPPPPPPPPPQPISTFGNCAGDPRTAKIQQAVNDGDLNQDNSIDVIVGFGEDDNGEFTLAVCSDEADGSQVPCAGWCERDGYGITFGKGSPACTAALAAAPYNGMPGPNGELPIECRPCELASNVQPTGPTLPPDADYCWQHSHQVDANESFFIPVKKTETGSATWTRFEGSSCYEVKVTFYGVEYTFYTPEGCPN